MKRLSLIMTLILAMSAAWAQQTLWVATGQVKYAFDTQQLGLMPFSNGGSTITLQGKAFDVNDIDSIYTTSEVVDGNTITVAYDGGLASATVAGNIAAQVSPTIDGAHVSMVQDSTMEQEVFYTLSGTSSNGSFYQSGNYKATLILNGLTLTSTRGAAITIDDGKRIEIQVIDGTTNTLADCAKGTQSACMVVEGHSEFKGGGTLVLTGNTKHGFKSDEYMELKKSFLGTIKVNSAVGDGLSVNQYLEMKSGNIVVAQCDGDGIQVDCKKDSTKVNNGQFIMSGGNISVNAIEDGGKGIKVEKNIYITGGQIQVKADDNALHSKASIYISDGDIYAYSVSAHGVNGADTTTISGGTVVAYAPSTVGYGLRGATGLYIKGGNIAAIGALTSVPKASTDDVPAQPVITFTGTTPQGNYALNDANGNNVLAFAQARAYSSSKKHTLLLSSPSIAAGTTYTLYNGCTLDTGKENWNGLYTGGDAVTQTGTALGSVSAATPYAQLQ
ncbi:MAG: carbohydrate-binding domain-containing protein [Muribaculaceae bacterium]|nr:carbohydrate-binding domain-containing protein [Muribaculaceae bacterium]